MKVLLCYAHCDDELLWGHPWLLNRSIERRVLICSSDAANPARQSYRRGPEALAAVCEATGTANHRALSFFSEFYKLRTRGAGDGPLLKDWWAAAQHAIAEMSAGCDFIATHSPIGEYGHMDHLMVRRAVMETTDIPVKWTDAKVVTTTWPLGVARPHGRMEDFVESDAKEFADLKAMYVDRDCWTWSSAEPLNVRTMRE